MLNLTIFLQNKTSFAAAIFAASVLGFSHDHAAAADCPSEDFGKFLAAYSADTATAQRHTASTLNMLALKPATGTDAFAPQTTRVTKAGLTFPLMAPITATRNQGIEVEPVDDKHITVVDKRAGNSNIKIFNFAREACWVLEGVEDWSIDAKDIPASSNAHMSTAENLCYQRARTFGRLGGLQQYALTGEFFEAALENYVCAAASGDPQASLNAASLSLSGMASQLDTPKVEALFKAAATTLADGASSLSTFYCYGNTTLPEGTCRQPALAEKELIRAVSMGSVDAANYLGYAFEQGLMVTKDAYRALACYQLAAAKGNKTAAANLVRLQALVADADRPSQCLTPSTQGSS